MSGMNRDPQKMSIRNVESLQPSHIFTDTAADRKTNCLDRIVQKGDNRKWYVTL